METPTADKLNAHLKSGGVVQVATVYRATIYREKHASIFFQGADGNLYVKVGKGSHCLTYGNGYPCLGFYPPRPHQTQRLTFTPQHIRTMSTQDQQRPVNLKEAFRPDGMPGMRLHWWTLATKQQVANYISDKPEMSVPALGKCSILAYPLTDADRVCDVVLIGNPRDARTRNSDGVKLYTIEHYIKA